MRRHGKRGTKTLDAYWPLIGDSHLSELDSLLKRHPCLSSADQGRCSAVASRPLQSFQKGNTKKKSETEREASFRRPNSCPSRHFKAIGELPYKGRAHAQNRRSAQSMPWTTQLAVRHQNEVSSVIARALKAARRPEKQTQRADPFPIIIHPRTVCLPQPYDNQNDTILESLKTLSC